MNIFLRLDNYISGPLLERFGSSRLKRVAALLTHSGDALVHIPLFLYFYFYCREPFPAFAAMTFYSTITGVLILYAIRLSFKRRRPIGDMPKEFAIVPMLESYSFPSGHAMRNFLFCVTSYPFFGIYTSACLFIFAALIASTRIYLKLHYFSDILAGGALGMFTGYVFIKLYL